MTKIREEMERELGELDLDDLEVLEISEEFDKGSKLIDSFL